MSSESGSSQKPPQSTIDLTSMTPMEFTVVSEPWTKYKLEDQTKLFVKLVVVKVVRGLNEQGQPAYESAGANSDQWIFGWTGVAVQSTPKP